MKPVQVGMQLLDSMVLHNEHTIENVMTVRKHTITTEDDLVQLG